MASVVLNPSTVSVSGTWTLSVAYSGFNPNSAITVSVGGWSLTPQTTDSNGNWSAQFSNPGPSWFVNGVLPHLSGTVPWVVSDGTNTASANLTVVAPTTVNTGTSVSSSSISGVANPLSTSTGTSEPIVPNPQTSGQTNVSNAPLTQAQQAQYIEIIAVVAVGLLAALLILI